MLSVPCLIREATDSDMMFFSIEENDCRVDLNPVERARAYKRILDAGTITQEELSRRLNRSHAFVAQSLLVLGFPTAIQARVAAGTVSASVCAHMLRLRKSPEAMDEAITRIEELIASTGTAKIREVKELARSIEERHATSDAAADDQAAGDAPRVPLASDRRESASVRNSAPPASQATIGAWRRSFLDEVLFRELERRGPEEILKALGVTLARAWSEDLAGPTFRVDFFNLHDKPQLVAIAKELKATIDVTKPKEIIVKQILTSPNSKRRLPKELIEI
jgi:ParB-like chromosome segregation protein Spo0J